MTMRILGGVGVLVLALGTAGAKDRAVVSSLPPAELVEFASCPEEIQELLRYGLSLTEEELRYQYGSGDPANGGMDCSGTVSHILRNQGYAAPRMAHTIYRWADRQGDLTRVEACHSRRDPQLDGLRPGDLLFWEGTYDVGERNPPISHVMIYLGRKQSNGKPVMVGASSGRYYEGRARHGVSVFDFRMPRRTSSARFVAYAKLPGIRWEEEQREAPETAGAPAQEARTLAVVAGESEPDGNTVSGKTDGEKTPDRAAAAPEAEEHPVSRSPAAPGTPVRTKLRSTFRRLFRR